MKSIKRLLLGVFSSLLLAAGLHATADRVDPLSRSLGNGASQPALKGAPDSGSYCEFSDDNS